MSTKKTSSASPFHDSWWFDHLAANPQWINRWERTSENPTMRMESQPANFPFSGPLAGQKWLLCEKCCSKLPVNWKSPSCFQVFPWTKSASKLWDWPVSLEILNRWLGPSRAPLLQPKRPCMENASSTALLRSFPNSSSTATRKQLDKKTAG